MQTKTHKIQSLLQRYAPGLPILALVLALAALLAHWTWIFIAPSQTLHPTHATQTDIASAARLITTQHLFGTAQSTSLINNDDSLSHIRLKGVFAALKQNHSYAILNTGAKADQTVRIGDEIQAGVTLKNIYPLYIVISHDGALKRVNLPQSASAATSIQAETAQIGIRSVGYNAFSISRDILSAALQSNDTNIKLGKLSPATGGGLLVTEASSGSLAEKLGLRAGDILYKVNNHPVPTMADLSGVYQKFKQAPQVQLDLTRAGKPVQLRYTVQQ